MLGSNFNAFIMSKMKVASQGKAFWMRAIVSSLGGELLDSCIFCPIAFWGIMSPKAILGIILTQVCVKTLYELIVLPLTSLIVKRLKQKEGEDAYDVNISYNPFRLSDI